MQKYSRDKGKMRLTKEIACQDARIFAQHIVIAVDCMDQSSAMDRIFRDSRFSSTYRVAPHFFRTTYHALRFRFEVEVSKLFDQNGKSFDSFKNDLIHNNIIPAKETTAYKNARQVAQKDLSQIHKRRNKIHAHSDSEVFGNPDVFSEENPFCWDNIRKLLIHMLYICNLTIFKYTEAGVAQTYGISNSDDFVRLFDCKTAFEKQCDKILKNFGGKPNSSD